MNYIGLLIFFILMIWLHCWSHSLDPFTMMNTEKMNDFIKKEHKKRTFIDKLKTHYLSYKYRLQDWLEKYSKIL